MKVINSVFSQKENLYKKSNVKGTLNHPVPVFGFRPNKEEAKFLSILHEYKKDGIYGKLIIIFSSSESKLASNIRDFVLKTAINKGKKISTKPKKLILG